jgi:hypothetical protein
MSPVSVVPFLPDGTTQVVPSLSKSGVTDLQNTIYLQHFRRKNTLKRLLNHKNLALWPGSVSPFLLEAGTTGMVPASSKFGGTENQIARYCSGSVNFQGSGTLFLERFALSASDFQDMISDLKFKS